MGLGAGLAISGLAGAASGFLNKNKQTINQGPLETPEQAEARRLLLDFAKSGEFSPTGFKAGESLGLPLGDFGLTDIEQTGLGNLRNLVGSNNLGSLDQAEQSLLSFLNPDMDSINEQFAPFKTMVNREIRERSDDLKRNAAFGRNLFNSRTIESLGDIQNEGSEILASKLAELFNTSQNRALTAAQAIPGVATTRDNLNIGRINASQRFGGLERFLSNQQLQSEFDEALRRRGELLLPLEAAKSVVGSQPSFGVGSLSVPQRSPFQDLLDITAQIGGGIIGQNLFNPQPNAPTRSAGDYNLPATTFGPKLPNNRLRLYN